MDPSLITTVEYHNQHPVIDAQRGISGSHLPADSGKTGGQTSEQDLQTGKYHGIMAKNKQVSSCKDKLLVYFKKPPKGKQTSVGKITQIREKTKTHLSTFGSYLIFVILSIFGSHTGDSQWCC